MAVDITTALRLCRSDTVLLIRRIPDFHGNLFPRSSGYTSWGRRVAGRRYPAKLVTSSIFTVPRFRRSNFNFKLRRKRNYDKPLKGIKCDINWRKIFRSANSVAYAEWICIVSQWCVQDFTCIMYTVCCYSGIKWKVSNAMEGNGMLKLSSRWKLRNGTSLGDTRHVRNRPPCLHYLAWCKWSTLRTVSVKLGTTFVLLLEITVFCAQKKLDFVVLLYRHYKSRQLLGVVYVTACREDLFRFKAGKRNLFLPESF